MRFVKAADDYIIKFFYKKQVKVDITYLCFLLLSTITSFVTKNSYPLSFTFLASTIIVLVWSIVEIKSKREINRYNRLKVRLFYGVSLLLYLTMPMNSYTACLVFIIPYNVFFIDLIETYCGHDSLHWPYIFHLVYGSLIFVIASIIKPFIPNNIFTTTKYFSIVYNPIIFTMIIDNIACELVDLRTIFKSKMLRDEVVACYDELTETHNRYGLLKLYDIKNATSIALIDLDHFKHVNDKYGHDIGDLVLKEFANRLLSFENDNNFICRWGGEEFIIIANSIGDLGDICVKLLINMRSNPIPFVFNNLNVMHTQTFSCGIAEILSNRELDEMVKIADIQAYKAKENGRNHIYFNNKEII